MKGISTVEKSSQEKVVAIGRAYIKKNSRCKWIPIISSRLIKRGKKKGWYEVTIPNGRKFKIRIGYIVFNEVE